MGGLTLGALTLPFFTLRSLGRPLPPPLAAPLPAFAAPPDAAAAASSDAGATCWRQHTAQLPLQSASSLKAENGRRHTITRTDQYEHTYFLT